MGNGTHWFEGAHGHGTAAVPEAATVGRKCFLENRDHHSGFQVEFAVTCLQHPAVQALLDCLQFPVPGTTVAEEISEQPPQAFHPLRAASALAQLSDRSCDLIQERPPALELLKAQIR